MRRAIADAHGMSQDQAASEFMVSKSAVRATCIGYGVELPTPKDGRGVGRREAEASHEEVRVRGDPLGHRSPVPTIGSRNRTRNSRATRRTTIFTMQYVGGGHAAVRHVSSDRV